MDSLEDKIEKDGIRYYLYITYQPVFDKNTGKYIQHGYTISYVSENKILTLVRENDLNKAIQSTISELEKI